MKKLTLVISSLSMIFVYVIASYINDSFNFHKWEHMHKSYAVFIWFGIVVVTMSYLFDDLFNKHYEDKHNSRGKPTRN